MLFNSVVFIFAFLPLTFFIYFYLNHKKLTEFSKLFLLLASLFFYSWWNISYLPLILFSILFNYFLGTILLNKKSKIILTFGIVVNLSLLGYFKYFDFFIENINFIFNSNITLLNIALPLAISFFTFQQIAYLVDSYRNELKSSKFLNYALFVTFFPQLIAGPIVHYQEVIPQFEKLKNKVINYKNIALGLFIFSIGLFKKVVIADTFATWVNIGFDESTTLSFFESWATSLSFTFQIYFDFSAYSDMAIGLGLLFNIKLPINFNSPYKATSLIEFWQKWHITLTKFINSYIFKPIIKSFKTYSFTKAMFTIFITMIIVGLWHGASWTFIAFGAIHGVALIINHYFKKYKIKVSKIVGWFLTFNIANISLIFFRSNDFESAFKVLKGMLRVTDITNFSFSSNFLYKLSMYLNINLHQYLPFEDKNSFVNENTFLFITFALFIILFLKNTTYYLQQNMNTKLIIISSILFSYSIICLFVFSTKIFLYFNF